MKLVNITKILSFLGLVLWSSMGYAIPITSPDGTPAEVTQKNQLLVRSVNSDFAAQASRDGDAFIFTSDFVTILAAAGEETVIFIQNKSQTRIFSISAVSISGADPSAKFRAFLKVTADNAVTTIIPANLNATSTRQFDGVVRIMDGSDTAGRVGGTLIAQSFEPFLVDTRGSLLLGFNDSITMSVDTVIDADVSAVIAGEYVD